MAIIDFDHGTVTHSIDFDSLTPAEIAVKLGTGKEANERYAKLVEAMAGVAHDQATLNKLVATGVQLAVKQLASGSGVAGLLGALV